MGSRPLVPRILRVLLAVGVATFVAPAASHAHGDGPTHYLETQGFYPGVSPAPAPKVELQLMGYVQAAQQAGYPMRVAVANEGDVTDRPDMVRRPQAYAEDVARTITYRRLDGPVVIVTGSGVGVAGWELVGGERRKLTRARAAQLVEGVEVPLNASSDLMARTAMDAVRQIARAGGHPLPARVPPATVSIPTPRTPAGNGIGGWMPLVVFGAVFGTAALLFEARARLHRRRRLSSLSSTH